MKKLLINILLVPVVLGFAVDLQRALQIYNDFREMYFRGEFSHPFLELLQKELKNLSLYRFYKNLLDKSVDRREATPDLGSYLAKIYDSASFDDENEQLAASIFMAYLVSELNRTRFSSEMIMKNDAFVEFFTAYRDVVSREARSFFAWIISYQLGLCEEKPPVEVEVIESLNDVSYRFTPPSQLAHISDLALFYSDPSVQDVLHKAIVRAKQNISSDPSRAMAHINREANFVARDIFKPITTFQAQVAKEAVKITPVKSNFMWVRFLIYLALLYLFRKKTKALAVLTTAILTVEVLFLILVFEPFSTYQGLVYGLIAVFGFGFAAILVIRRFLKKRSFAEPIFLVVFAIVIFLPFIRDCRELSMDNFVSLKESVYYSTLKRELFEDELSKVFQLTRSLATNLYASVDETKKVFNELLDTFTDAAGMDAFDELVFLPSAFIGFADQSPFYSAGNFDYRLNLFKTTNRTIENFLIDEAIRRRNFEKNLKNLKAHLGRIMLFSADFLRSDVAGHVEELFTVDYPILSDVLPRLELFSHLGKPVVGPDISIFKEITALRILVAVMLTFVALILLKPVYVLPAASMTVIYAVLKWISFGTVKVFVEQGIPVIEFQYNGTFNPGIFILAVILFVISILKLLKKGERV